MRYTTLMIALLLVGCGGDAMTRNFSLNRDAGQDNLAAAQPPLSMPPNLGLRPPRPGAPTLQTTGQLSDQAAGSPGQDALVDSAGPPAAADIRSAINDNAGMINASPAFVDALMNWTPPPGYTPLTAPPKKGWFSRLF
jgi:Protein of unknown function (DUF3035)